MTCPFCAERIQDAAIICKHCGRDIPPPAVRAAMGLSPAPGRTFAAKFLTVVAWVLVIAGLLAVLGQFARH